MTGPYFFVRKDIKINILRKYHKKEFPERLKYAIKKSLSLLSRSNYKSNIIIETDSER